MFTGPSGLDTVVNGVIAGAEGGVQPEPLTEDDIARLEYIEKKKEEEVRRRKVSGIERQEAIEKLNRKPKKEASGDTTKMKLIAFFVALLIISFFAIFLLRDKLFYDL